MSVKPGVYRHFKGGVYTVVGEATDSETGQLVVVYQASDGRLWTRSSAMFAETVKHDGVTVPRFAPFNEFTSGI